MSVLIEYKGKIYMFSQMDEYNKFLLKKELTELRINKIKKIIKNTMKESKKLICVICGQEWKNKYTNRCENKECSGFELNKPESFNVDDKGN